MPVGAQHIYQSAFNSAYEQYKDRGDQREPLSHGTAWAAVKTKYKQDNEGNWVAKEGTMKESISVENKRQLLQSALLAKFGEPASGMNYWVEDMTDTDVVYSQDGQSYRAAYVVGEDGNITLGEPEKVVRQTVYASVESLRKVYSDIIQEVGRRNASTDSARIRKIVELCQELLSSEDEAKAKEALKEAKSVLAWLKEQAAMKTEDGVEFPAAAYAYAPDPEKPSEWKLRLWEDPTKKVTRKQLGAAAAALSPGGFRGQKVDIPSDDLPGVKRKIRAAYRSLDVPDDEMPRWIKESESREPVFEVTQLTEAELNNKGIAQLVVIQPGFNASKEKYYPADMLARDYSVFEGAKMFSDHATEAEEKERPERSIKDWVATLKNVKVDEQGRVVGEAVVIEPWMQEKLAQLRDKGLLSEMGVSINAVGTGIRSTIEGIKTSVIEKLNRIRSVDFVTWPGAGGMVTLYEADREHDVDLINLETFRERRPDLAKQIESAAKAEIMQEVKQKMELEERVKELEGEVGTLTDENTDLKGKIAEADKAKAKAEAQAKIKEAVGKAELPDATRARITERFKDAESDEGVAEAITDEATYIATLAEAGKVKGMGTTSADPNPEKSRAALKESFKASYKAAGKPDDEAEKLAEIAATGR